MTLRTTGVAAAAWMVLVGVLLVRASPPNASALAQRAAGNLDRSFGDRGKVLTRAVLTRAGENASSIALTHRGRIVVAGDSGNGAFGVARFKPNGALDRSFDGDGKLRTRFEGWWTSASAVAIGPRRRIVAAGATNDPGMHQPTLFALARYRPDGRLDDSFSRNGKATVNFVPGSGGEGASTVAIDSRGRIVVAGFAPGQAASKLAVARLKRNGRLDRSFSGDGKMTVSAHGYGASSVAIDGHGRIVAAGGTALVRLEPNGRLDRSFGTEGVATASFEVHSVALDARGRIVAAGEEATGPNPGDTEFALSRYRPSGHLDHSFGTDGNVTTSFGGTFDFARSVAIDSRGRVVAFGRLALRNGGRFAVARYRPTGTLDRSFSRDGKLTTNFPGTFVRANAVKIDDRDRIVAAGEAKHRFALARYVGYG